MAVESFYFSHDYGARNDPKMQKVLMRLGQAGKGVYWDLIEMLYEEGGYLFLSEIESYAFALRTDTNCITQLINDFGLFQKDSEKFWSDSVLKRLFLREEKSKKAAKSASIRWKKHKDNANASKPDANALQTQSDSNAIKERKEKDIKEKNIIDSVSVDNIESIDELESFNIKTFKSILINLGAKKDVLDDWLIVRKGKKASNTKTALKAFVNECRKSNVSVSEAVKVCAEKGWSGFKYEWLVESDFTSSVKNDKPKELTAIERRNAAKRALEKEREVANVQ